MRYVTDPTPGSPGDLQDDADPEQVARTILLRRLSAAPRSRSELRSDLLRRGLAEDVADRVLDRFTEVGLIDDTSYAAAWVESRQRTRGSARGILRQELRSKGISDDDAALALDAIDEEAERARAVQLVQVKARAMTRLESEVRARRLVSMLMRRGYRHGTALSVVTEVLGELPDDYASPDDGGEAVSD
jgi:regulatory protein